MTYRKAGTTSISDWVPGDLTGLQIPAHIDALNAAGIDFLTLAFRTSGALTSSNRVTHITQSDELAVGGTGRKLLLAVEYERSEPNLPTELFVKFSRHSQDPVRDAARYHMEPEVRLAALSRNPAFPIVVPECLFADFHNETGTGLLITERVPFGTGRIERHYTKCRDYELEKPLAHYEALIKALARLAGTHKAGRLGAIVDERFPLDLDKLMAANRIPYTAERLAKRVSQLHAFSDKYPHLLPANVRSGKFMARVAKEAPFLHAHEKLVEHFLHKNRDFLALCHFNAHIDNAWYWRNVDGQIECGLLDWGSVGQMPLAATLWGCLSGAEIAMWDEHLDHLLRLFVGEFYRSGGPSIDVGELKTHLEMKAVMMGLAWVMDAPLLISREIPTLSEQSSRFDEVFEVYETSRVQLHALSVFLHLWEQRDPVGVVRALAEQ